MTEIKIKNKEWFMRHCEVQRLYWSEVMVPSCWTREQQSEAVSYCLGGRMWEMAGKVFKVDEEAIASNTMKDAKYKVNWAIEWVKEVEE